MLSLDLTLLKTQNLHSLIQSDWYAQELARWQLEAQQFDIDSYKALNQLTWPKAVRKIEALLEEQAYIEAAICLQACCNSGTTPVISAIQFDDVNLLMACLALGNKVNERAWSEDRFPLTEAMIVNNVEIFNLLLLVPNINVNVEAEVKGEFDDISQFLGKGEQFEYFRPLETLLSAAYAPILTTLNIDTEKRYGPQRVPLMVHAYSNNNIRLMNWLVFCGAEINPYLDGYSGAGPNLINLALYDYLTYKDERHTQLLKWFARFATLLTGRSELSLSFMQDLIDSAEHDSPELIGWFDLRSVTNSKQEMDEELIALTEKNAELQCALNQEKQKLAALTRVANQVQKDGSEPFLRVSLLEELKRVHRVEANELLNDLFVEVNETQIAMGLAYDDDLIYLELQSPDKHYIEGLLSAAELLTYSKFQLMLYFLSLPERFWFKLSLLAEMHDVYLFKSIDGNYLTTQKLTEVVLVRILSGDFECLNLDQWRVLHKYLSTLATEIGLIQGDFKLAEMSEEVCRKALLHADSDPDYFSDLEIKTMKNAETKVFDNLQPLFETTWSAADQYSRDTMFLYRGQ